MRSINLKAKKTVEKLIEKMEDGYLKLDTSRSCMALVVEDIGSQQYSFAHYGKQNGDLMKDPEIVLWKNEEGNFFPIMFQNDYAGVYQESVIFENGKPSRLAKKVQKDQAVFFGQWMENINNQQEF